MYLSSPSGPGRRVPALCYSFYWCLTTKALQRARWLPFHRHCSVPGKAAGLLQAGLLEAFHMPGSCRASPFYLRCVGMPSATGETQQPTSALPFHK